MQCDEFQLEAADLGALYKIKVRNDGSSIFKKEWYVLRNTYTSVRIAHLVLHSRFRRQQE